MKKIQTNKKTPKTHKKTPNAPPTSRTTQVSKNTDKAETRQNNTKQRIKSIKAQNTAEKKELLSGKKGIEKRGKKKNHLLVFSTEKLISRDFPSSFGKYPVNSYLDDQTMAEAWDTKLRRNTELKTCF